VPESLKNILLVMSSSGYLVPPEQNPEKRDLWDQTWRHLDRFLPQLRKELFPESGKIKSPAIPQGKMASVNAAANGSGSKETPKEKGKEAEKVVKKDEKVVKSGE
jgi:brefeldin A-resistance guanine nucleotide exchange factor 1